MWTKKAHFIIVYFQINNFRLPIILPTFCINSLVSEICDLINFFTFFSSKVTFYINLAETGVYALTGMERYDLVDIDVKEHEDNSRVKIKIYTR